MYFWPVFVMGMAAGFALSYFFDPARDAYRDQRKARDAALDEAIREVASGRTINNFGHVPEVRRALEWVLMDLRGLKGRP